MLDKLCLSRPEVKGHGSTTTVMEKLMALDERSKWHQTLLKFKLISGVWKKLEVELVEDLMLPQDDRC